MGRSPWTRRSKLPSIVAQLDAPRGTVAVPHAEQTIALLRGRFRNCYNRGLQLDPAMAGSLVVRVKIAPNGEVTRADPAAVNGLSGEVAGCIAKVVADATFDSPGSSGSTLDVPVKMLQQR